MIEIIAEIGVNHNGDLATACALVDAAIDAGCDVVKTQLWNTERVYPRERWAAMKALELGHENLLALKKYCDSKGIELLVTPDELADAIFLHEQLGVQRIKTSSADITNLPFLRDIARLGLPMIVSTGACEQNEMVRAIVAVKQVATAPVTILHCVSAYPAPLEEQNLRVVWKQLRGTFANTVGFSDHTRDNLAAVMALALGATVFEKHLTLNSDGVGPDHATSLEPAEMFDYVRTLRRCETALGNGVKEIQPSERLNRNLYDKMILRKMYGGKC